MPEQNPLKEWKEKHWQNICQEVREAGLEFKPENIEAIVKLMSFTERSKRHPERCSPFYNNPIKTCHPEIPPEDFNCLVCACPNYKDQELEGACRIKSQKGRYKNNYPYSPQGIVWDCSNCSNYHTHEEATLFLQANLIWLGELSKK